MTIILDCTIRDGGYTVNWDFDDNFVEELLKSLVQLGITYCEIGYRNHYDIENKGKFYNCSPQMLKEFYEKKGTLLLGVMTDASRYSDEDFAGANEDYIDFVRVACHYNQIKEALDISKRLYDKGYQVFVQLMDVANIDVVGYMELASWPYKNILSSLYIADSLGNFSSEDVESYIAKLKTLGYEKISFHAHNTNGLALENSLKAIDLGVFSIDTTKDGIGRNGGNLNMSELLAKYKLTTNCD